jgi:ABC-2 type transport system ATP-binding protein
LKKALQELPQTVNVRQVDGNRYEVEARRDVRSDVAEVIVQAGGKLLALNIEHQSLDDIYTRYFEEVKNAKTV